MATETKIKFRQGAIPAGSVVTNSIALDTTGSGEPLWDTTNKKLYVTNGLGADAEPTLIGPIKVSYVQQSTINETNGTHIGTITIDGNETKIYAPTAGESVSQTLDVVNSNETNPTLITLTDTNSIELRSSTANTNVTTVIAGAPAGADASGKAKLFFDVQINTIDGGSWDTTNGQ